MKSVGEWLRIGRIGIERYMPRTGGKAPVVVILPILDDQKYLVERYFARYFAKHGFGVLIVERKKSELACGEQINEMLEQAVDDIRLIINWAEQDPNFDKDRIAMLGISLGGIYGTILAVVDQRIKAAALALVGGDLPSILEHSRDKGIVRRREKYLKEKEITLAEFECELRNSIVFDPLAFARNIDPEKILLVLAKFDAVIPYKNGLMLRTAMKSPKTIVLWSGHYTAMLYLLYIRRAVLKFFRRKLGV